MNGLALKDLARALALVAHDGQVRKGTGEPYFNHVEFVANSVQGWRAKTIAYLHDLVEDTQITCDMLLKMGFPLDIVNGVKSLTREEHLGETYMDFIERTCKTSDQDVHHVKLADIRHNLSTLDDLPGDRERKRKRYIKAEARLLDRIYGSEEA